MLIIQKKLTPYNFSAMTNKKNEYIVVHYVGAVSTAKNNADYYASQKLVASANYYVDQTSIWQGVEDSDRAWHCGGGLQGPNGHTFFQKCTNSNSIGIEMCVKKTATGVWYFEPETVANTVDLVKYLMQKHGVPLARVIRHFDVTGKICPAPYVDEAAWATFKSKLSGNTIPEEQEDAVMVYNAIDDTMPAWAKATIQKLVTAGALKGDDKGNLNLTDEMLRIFVTLDRTGAIDK